MRQRKPDLRARVNGDLQLEFDDVALTSYAGLELFVRYPSHALQYDGARGVRRHDEVG
jgi:hypothetical protein